MNAGCLPSIAGNSRPRNPREIGLDHPRVLTHRRVADLGIRRKLSRPMFHIEKDPSLETLLVQEALKARGLYTGEADNWRGPRTEDALAAFQRQILPHRSMIEDGAAPRQISADGLALIKAFEGLFLGAYQDTGGVWTIGWGHTGITHQDGTVHKGRTITEAEAENLLAHDLRVFEDRVSRLITVPLNDDEFAALVSFDFNTGGLGDSTLRRLLNAEHRTEAALEFARWNKDNGRVLAGLTRRRQSERNLFLGKRPFIVE